MFLVNVEEICLVVFIFVRTHTQQLHVWTRVLVLVNEKEKTMVEPLFEETFPGLNKVKSQFVLGTIFRTLEKSKLQLSLNLHKLLPVVFPSASSGNSAQTAANMSNFENSTKFIFNAGRKGSAHNLSLLVMGTEFLRWLQRPQTDLSLKGYPVVPCDWSENRDVEYSRLDLCMRPPTLRIRSVLDQTLCIIVENILMGLGITLQLFCSTNASAQW